MSAVSQMLTTESGNDHGGQVEKMITEKKEKEGESIW